MYFVSMRRLVYVTLVCLGFVLRFRGSLTREMCGEEENDRLLARMMMPDVPHPHSSRESNVDVKEEDTVLLSWCQILRLLTRWDPFIHNKYVCTNWKQPLMIARQRMKC